MAVREARWLISAFAVGALSLASVGCSHTCNDGDLGCLMESMQIFELGTVGSSDPSSTAHQSFELDVELASEGPAEVWWVKTDTLPGGDPTPNAPTITNQLAPVSVSQTNTVGVTQLDWTDPNGCVGLFCTRIRDGRTWYIYAPCTRPKRDGNVVGRSYLGVRYQKVPESQTAMLEAQVVPIAGPGCPDLDSVASSGDGSFEDPLVLGPTAAESFHVGNPAELSIIVAADSQDSTDDGSAVCTDFVQFCDACGTIQACVQSSGGSCTAWYQTQAGARYPCNGCGDCTQAATAVVSDCGCGSE